MKKLFLPILLASATILSPLQVCAEDLIDHSSNIFKFQQKMADKGNVSAQYKLAFMYEKGDGVAADIEKAKSWYTSAAAAGSVAASQRSEYLAIKERGYDETKDASWLASVKASTLNRNAEAMYLMAQLHQSGIGVNKDLKKSLALYQQVASLGVADVEPEVTEVNKALRANKQAAARRNSVSKKEQKTVEISPVAKAKSKQQMTQAAILTEQEKAMEKRKRYEKVMEQIRLEQKLIDDQQQSVSGVVANVDDEI